jgi:hypothetical protein
MYVLKLSSNINVVITDLGSNRPSRQFDSRGSATVRVLTYFNSHICSVPQSPQSTILCTAHLVNTTDIWMRDE